MSDTPSNQKEYPQHGNQAQGCGFPLAKLVVMFSLATGAALEVKISQWFTGEVNLARQIYSMLNPGDVALADRAFGTYADLALVQRQGADGVFRKHQSRKTDFRTGKKLGIGDHIVTWSKPPKCPSGVNPETWSAFPESMQVRVVHLLIQRPGFRPRKIVVVTTLLDATVYTRQKIAQLYLWRWQVEVNLRHIKTTLGMDVLRGKTPEMVRKEIYVHLMAYNLLRALMWKAAKQAGVCPLRVSLKGTRQLLNHFQPKLATAGKRKHPHLIQALLQAVTRDLLPERPYRYEPRLKKRRPKPYGRLQQPRNTLKLGLSS